MPELTVHDVPGDVRQLLIRAAERSGASLRGYLLSVLEREACSTRNAELAQLEAVGGGLLRWTRSWQPFVPGVVMRMIRSDGCVSSTLLGRGHHRAEV
jgi:hypothetical protein